VQIASDWLLAHVNDPSLDEVVPRNYVVYLCPSGDLLGQLQTYWDASRTQVGWNGAHNSFPHITLTHTFSCGDTEVDDVVDAVRRVAAEHAHEFQTPLRLEKYLSPNFFGLFVGKREESALRALAADLTRRLVKIGVAEPDQMPDPSPTKSYHVTLAYQFVPQHLAALEDLVAASVDPTARSDWELKLYSFEDRMRNHDAYRVVHNYMPREDDELELRASDLVYVRPEEVDASTDGWVLGTSWLTGCRGYVPKNHLQQTAETDAWTMHFGLPMTGGNGRVGGPHLHPSSDPLPARYSSSSLERLKSTTGSLNRRQSSQQQLHLDDAASTPSRPRSASALSGPVQRRLIRSPAPNQPLNPQQPRRVFVARHGERVDFTFGTWIPFCFDEKGNYSQKDLNMPTNVPRRAAGPEGFALDCPLTRVGITQARMVGEGLRRKEVSFSHVYSSPSLRCVQTCHNILVGLGLQHQLKINVEPGLFEWLMWYMNGVPDWMRPEELLAAGHNVQLNYKPYISAEELQNTLRETPEDYYTRNFFVTQCILQATEDKSIGGGSGGNVLLVGHAATLDACTRQLTGRPPPLSSQEMMTVVRKVPYCSIAVAEEHRDVVVSQSGVTGTAASRKSSLSHHSMASSAAAVVVKSTWKVVEPPIPPLTHCSNDSFNWNILCGT